MAWWEFALGAVLMVISVIMVVVVLKQQSKAEGLSGAIAGGSDSFYGKHKGRSQEAKLEKITKVLSVVFIVLTLATTVLLGFFG